MSLTRLPQFLPLFGRAEAIVVPLIFPFYVVTSLQAFSSIRQNATSCSTLQNPGKIRSWLENFYRCGIVLQILYFIPIPTKWTWCITAITKPSKSRNIISWKNITGRSSKRWGFPQLGERRVNSQMGYENVSIWQHLATGFMYVHLLSVLGHLNVLSNIQSHDSKWTMQRKIYSGHAKCACSCTTSATVEWYRNDDDVVKVVRTVSCKKIIAELCLLVLTRLKRFLRTMRGSS